MTQFVTGIIFGMTLIVTFSHIPNSKISKYNEAIELCEKNLPRSENCVIVALPVSKD